MIKIKTVLPAIFLGMAATFLGAVPAQGAEAPNPRDYSQWKLQKEAEHPANNAPTAARVELGKMLFFDPRLSRDGNTSCASCHNPGLGWSDGLATARGFQGKLLERASPSIVNTAFNTIHMWDGRKKSLEDQALGPMEAAPEMNTDFERFFAWISKSEGYQAAFAKAYPGKPVGPDTLKLAIASFERTIVSRTSPFDRWVAGDKKAMSPQQMRGMLLFTDKDKANCIACHAAPNFTDNGFHNLGLASFGNANPDLGRFAQKPVALMKGAFKTPSLRDVERTAPYFHDGSARTLMDVVEHYARGGDVRTNLSPNMKTLALNQGDKDDLVAFLKALSSPVTPMTFPILPQD